MSNSTNSTHHAETEGGIFNGIGPLSLPILILLVQVMLIQFLVRVLAYPLKFIKQPRVIAEVLAGILLGPTALGKIPGFTDALFNPTAMNNLNLVANFGLIFFLFIMGLELEAQLLKKAMKTTAIVTIFGMAVPFGLSMPVGYFMYIQFIFNETLTNSTLNPTGKTQVSLLSFLLFIGVAASVTAFPVLARILAEMHLLGTKVGTTVLAIAALDDAFAWVLLALVIAIAAAGNPLNMLYVFLCLAGFIIFMFTLARWGVQYVIKKVSHKTNEVSFLAVVISLMVCMAASWFTHFIGVHAIFGAFLAGLIMPRKNNFSVHMIEKIEDIIAVIFLPLYFAYSGIRTDLTTLNNGMAWVGLLLIFIVVCFGKMFTVFAFSMLTGVKSWREALVMGIFMNCKGLVELIVLNVGLTAGILNTETFSIMVLLAIFTTFMTSPLAYLVYPPSARSNGESDDDEELCTHINVNECRPLICAISPLEVPLMLGFVDLLTQSQPNMTLFHMFRLLEITDRESSILHAVLADEDKGLQDTIGIGVRNFSKSRGLTVQRHFESSDIQHITPAIKQICEKYFLNLVVLPFMHANFHAKDFHHRLYDDSLREIVSDANTDVCVFIDHGATVITNRVNILLVYESGSKDSRVALQYAIKLLKSSSVLLTILHKSPAIIDEAVVLFDASRNSIENFNQKQKQMSDLFNDQKSVGGTVKNIKLIESLEALITNEHYNENDVLSRILELTESEWYLQFFAIPENLLTPSFYQNNLFPFSLVLSGRSDHNDPTSYELEQLVGRTAFDILSSDVGCGQMIFYSKKTGDSSNEKKSKDDEGERSINYGNMRKKGSTESL